MRIGKNFIVPGAIVVAALLGMVGSSLISNRSANAQTAGTGDTEITATTAATDMSTPPDPSKGGHVGSNGTKEELLTGDTAEKVKAAALAANPGGTIVRVETDAEGSAYEAHMKKADGTSITVKLDSNFKVTSTEEGHGAQ